MLRVHRSNRAERLLDSLAELVAVPLPDPFLRETVVVQGRGMERWLSLELARRLGVWANAWFPFPRTLLIEAMRVALGEETVRSGAAFEPEVLVWRIAGLLPALEKKPEFAPIRSYLAGDHRGVRRLQLASEIAAVFDRYVIYRPELVAAWERGRSDRGDPWQSILWRELAGESPTHLARRVERLTARLREGSWELAGFPPRISVFGISTIAPLYLRALEALSAATDVHLFLLAPSREFMGATVRPRQEARLREAQLELFARPDLHLERGNPLLDSLGKLGREFQELLEDVSYVEG
ncbi:MAG: exodeoxyribonuclease V subunit gamma, partial [Candidatus Binatia bacterium]